MAKHVPPRRVPRDRFDRKNIGKLNPAIGYTAMTADGDILYFDSASQQRLAKGSDTEILTLASGLPSWAAPAATYSDPLTTDGDVLIRDTTTKRLAKGSDTEVLTLASGLPTWAAPAYSDPLTTDGDVLIRDTTTKRLAKGSDTEVLTLASGLPTWAAPAGGISVTVSTSAPSGSANDGDLWCRV